MTGDGRWRDNRREMRDRRQETGEVEGDRRGRREAGDRKQETRDVSWEAGDGRCGRG